MSAEERRKAFAHRINQLVGDHYRAGFVESVKARRDIGERIHSALEDAYQMGFKDMLAAMKPLVDLANPPKVAERIEPQEP